MGQSKKEKANNDDGTQKEQGFNQADGLPIPCLKCNKTFQTAEEKVTHIKSSPLHICCQNCETCETIVEFNDFLSLYLHIKEHHSHLPAAIDERRICTNSRRGSRRGACCQNCDNVVETRSTLNLGPQHKTCSVWYCYTCNHQCKSRCRLCNDSDFESDVHLRMHYQSRHPGEYCPVCETIFDSVEDKVLHVKASSDHHCCENCEDVLYFLDRRKHYENCHPLEYCFVCATIFNSVEEKITHARTASGHHCCHHCDKIFDCKFIRTHYTNYHPLLYCSTCEIVFKSVEDKTAHIRTSPEHLCCQHCEDLREFMYEEDLRLHQRTRHKSLYCRTCDLLFPSVEKSFAHRQEVHHFCDGCHKPCYSALHLQYHRQNCDKLNPPKQKADPKPRLPRNHYETLGISPTSSHEQVLKAAKEMRIKVHPDRLKRAGGLTVEQERAIDLEAKLVGQAADVLSDPGLRRGYDLKL